MRNLNLLFTKIALFSLVIGAVASFTSCDKDEETVQTNYYSMTWESFSGGGTDFTYLVEMSTVETAFKSALGVSENPFTIEGTPSECDATVAAVCKLAEESLEGTVFTSITGKYVVTNALKNTTIYTYTIE